MTTFHYILYFCKDSYDKHCLGLISDVAFWRGHCGVCGGVSPEIECLDAGLRVVHDKFDPIPEGQCVGRKDEEPSQSAADSSQHATENPRPLGELQVALVPAFIELENMQF